MGLYSGKGGLECVISSERHNNDNPISVRMLDGM